MMLARQTLHKCWSKNNNEAADSLCKSLILHCLIGFAGLVSPIAGAQTAGHSSASPGPSASDIQKIQIPVTIAWQVPLATGASYEIEIAHDAGFAQSILVQPITGDRWQWTADRSGVYHWRILRPQQRAAGGEGNTFVSGSFVAVHPAESVGGPAVLGWRAEPNADRYKLLVLEGGVKRRIMMTQNNRFIVPQVNVPLMIEVVPYIQMRRLHRDFRLNPSLDLLVKKPLPRKEPEPVILPPAPPAPAQETPAPAPPPAAETAVADEPAPEISDPQSSVPKAEGASPPEPELQRGPFGHAMALQLIWTEEVLRAKRREIDIESVERLGGIGASFWTQPLPGLILQGWGRYHEHNADVIDESSVISDTIRVEASRYHLDGRLGYDILAETAADRHVVIVSLAGSLLQIPALPLEFTGAPGQQPRFKNETFQMIGGALTYGYFDDRFAVFVDGAALVQEKADAQSAYQRLWVNYYVSPHLSLEIGAFSSLVYAEFCSDDRDVCEREGRVETRARERGFYLGLGYHRFI